LLPRVRDGVKRPDAPDELHRAERPLLAKRPRREIGDLDGAAAIVEEARAQDRGVHVVGLLGANPAFEHDLRTAVFADAIGGIEQCVEHRIAIEARHAAPHHARLRFFWLCARQFAGGGAEPRSDGRDVRQPITRFRSAIADAHAIPAERLCCTDAVFVGHVVADEDGQATGERGLGHEGAHGATLGDTTPFQLEHEMAADPFPCVHRLGLCRERREKSVTADRFQLGTRPIVQRKTALLQFQDEPFVPSRQRLRASDDMRRRRCGDRGDQAIGAAPFSAVHTGRRQSQRLQEMIELIDRPAADHRERPVQRGLQAAQRGHHPRGRLHILRTRSERRQGAIEVEEQRGRRGDLRRVEVGRIGGRGQAGTLADSVKSGHYSLSSGRTFSMTKRAMASPDAR
jgi:hypothetical protein